MNTNNICLTLSDFSGGWEMVKVRMHNSCVVGMVLQSHSQAMPIDSEWGNYMYSVCVCGVCDGMVTSFPSPSPTYQILGGDLGLATILILYSGVLPQTAVLFDRIPWVSPRNCSSREDTSLGPRPKTNPARIAFSITHYTGSDIRGLGMRLGKTHANLLLHFWISA